MLSTNRQRPVIDSVPPRYRSARLEDLDDELRVRLQAAPWLVLAGETGRGKTHAMAALANALGQDGWIDWPEFLTDIKRAWDLKTSDAHEFDPLRWACGYKGSLFVDDIGAENPTDFAIERFQTLVNQRYLYRLPLVLTTNLQPAEFERRYGARTISRLVEMGEWVPVNGKDWRLELRAVRA